MAYTFWSLINIPSNWLMAFSAASRVSKCTNPNPFEPFSSQATFRKREMLTSAALHTNPVFYKHHLLCRIRWNRRVRRCPEELHCSRISPDSWWRCFPLRFCAVTGHAGTTSSSWVCHLSHQSSWCLIHARLTWQIQHDNMMRNTHDSDSQRDRG